ncbi:MAG TPA: DUF222 domain-containing protein [Acidimicrobiales bacterium]|nr:DUF222 domain-containing protein [Acidimicrobiales bacterium]
MEFVSMTAVTDMTEAIDHLVESDPSTFADAESIEALMRQFSRLEAVVTERVAAFDVSGDWAPDGARTAAAWLARRCRLPKHQARRMVHRGRELRHLPACERAWKEGTITGAHVDTLAAVRRDSTEELLQRDEKVLVDQATTLRFEDYVRVVGYWEQRADPNGAEDHAEKALARRDVYLEQSFLGTWLGKMTLDPISGAIVANELSRLERELFESDWSEARDRLGREPAVSDLSRTPGQRKSDALVEMATRSGTAPATGRRPAPLFSVFVDYESLNGPILELAQGTVVTPGSLVPWLDEAIIERAVFGPGPRVDIGCRTRLFTGATRRAIELRDRECTHPYCDGSAPCQVDHIIPYSQGGFTTQENGRLLCGFHNRLRNQRPPPGEYKSFPH